MHTEHLISGINVSAQHIYAKSLPPAELYAEGYLPRLGLGLSLALFRTLRADLHTLRSTEYND